ncbi:MAG: HAD family hydrolase [Anaerolineae bacterium]
MATDLDGTLLRPDYSISERTRRALDLARDHGARVVLVTGRPPRWVAPPVADTGLDGPVICANGAITYDPRRGEIVEHRTLVPQTARAIVDALRAELPGVAMAFEQGLTFGRERHWKSARGSPGEVIVDDVLEIASRPLSKLLARHPAADAADLAEVVVRAVGDSAVPTWSTDRMLEMSGAGVTKAAALATLASRLGVAPGEVVAFGDMPNDVAMLQWSGTGYAVANAHPDVLAAADAITASNADDGVALVLEQLFELESS